MFLIKHFIASNIHLGHRINKWNPHTSYFLLGIRDGIFIIDLEQTLIMLKRALTFIKKICLKRGYIFYIPSTKISFNNHIFQSFMDFSISSPPQISSLQTFRSFNSFFDKRINIPHDKNMGKFLSSRTKLDISSFQDGGNLIFLSSGGSSNLLYAFTQKRKMTGSDDLRDIRGSNSRPQRGNFSLKPAILFILETHLNTVLIKEALKLQIPVVGILDSNSNSYAINYPIPGNNDSNSALLFYTEILLHTVLDAKKHELQFFLNPPAA